MAEQTAAASSPAEVEDVFGGQHVTLDEYSRYRQDGELPTRFKPADNAETAPADPPKGAVSEGNEPESSGESEAPKDQQQETARKPHLTAVQRVTQLRATVEKLWEEPEPDTIKISQL